MTTKWTKGWRVFPNGSGYDIRDLSGNICTTYAHSSEEANAQLIASAPDLAERLELTNQQIKHAMDVLQGQRESTWQSLSDCLYANAAALRAARGEKGDNNVDTK